MNTQSYIPGQGYKDGYQDRMNGLADRSISYASSQPYWSEYKQGYREAERNIIEKAKQGITESKKFLTENSRWAEGKDE
jgi:hypothetical protein